MSENVHVIVADSAELFRSAVASVLDAADGFDVVAVDSTSALVAAAIAHPADVALVALDLPPDGAVAAIKAMLNVGQVQVVGWSSSATDDAIAAVLRAGAAGFLSKSISADGLARALRAVSNGEAALSRQLTRLAIDALHEAEARATARDRASSLSDRERGVLHLIARDYTNRQIAAQLCISEFTVKRHVQNILEKLGLPSRGAAATLYLAAFDLEDELTLRRARSLQ